MQGRNLAFHQAIALVEELRESLRASDPVERILAVNKDVLGVYETRVDRQQNLFGEPAETDGRVILYWAVIGLTADFLGESVEALTTVVLTHELAHAYTHLGADIDGYPWPTQQSFVVDLTAQLQRSSSPLAVARRAKLLRMVHLLQGTKTASSWRHLRPRAEENRDVRSAANHFRRGNGEKLARATPAEV